MPTLALARIRQDLIPFVLALLGLYLVALEQGQLLSLAQAVAAVDPALVHELLHDARHAAALPCH